MLVVGASVVDVLVVLVNVLVVGALVVDVVVVIVIVLVVGALCSCCAC